MKTTNKNVAPATGSSLNELIFENRNHAYGAYELRKKYDKRLFVGFLFAFFIFSSAISVQVIENYLSDTEFIFIPPKTTQIEMTDIDDDLPAPPPPPAPEIPVEMRRQAIFVPNIVDTTTTDLLLPTNEELIESAENDIPPILAVVPVSNKHKDEIDEEINKGYWNVDEPATFNGGNLDLFREWVVKNITYPQNALESGIIGKVNIIFGIDQKGKVCNVSIRRGIHPSLDEAVIRTILNSPAWQPAKENGNPVKQMFSLVVFFKQQ